jgi:hypothetical protein
MFHCAYTHKRKLHIIPKKCLKIILNRHWRYSTSTLQEETNVTLIKEFSNRMYLKFENVDLQIFAINFDL